MRNLTKTINVSSVAVKISIALITLGIIGVTYIGVLASNEAATLKKQITELQMQRNVEVSTIHNQLTVVTAELDIFKVASEAQQSTATALTTCQHDLETLKTIPKKKIVEAK